VVNRDVEGPPKRAIKISAVDRPEVNRAAINRAELIKTTPKEKSPTRKLASGLVFREREKGLEPSTSTLARRRWARNDTKIKHVTSGPRIEVPAPTVTAFIDASSTLVDEFGICGAATL
jgi:hypothetical protein